MADINEIGENIKSFVKKGFEAIENTASNIASNTKQKVDAFNLQGKRNEAIEELGKKAYELWESGVAMPDGLQDQLKEILRITEELEAMRPQAEENAPECCAGNAPEECAEEAEACCDEAEAPAPEEEAAEPEVKADPEEIPVPESGAPEENEVPVIDFGEKEEAPAKPASPLSSAINDLFEQVPPVDKMAEKVNNALDEMGDNLRKFSSDLGKQLSDMADDLMGGKNKKE